MTATAVKVVVLINVTSALLLIVCQIALYIIGKPGKNGEFLFYYISEGAMYASIGIWGGIIIIASSIVSISERSSKTAKFAMTILAAVIGIVIVGVFSNEMNRFVKFSNNNVSCNYYSICNLAAVEGLMIFGGLISTVMSILLHFEARKSDLKG